MRINSSDKYANQPILQIRKFLRYSDRRDCWNIHLVKNYLGLDNNEAHEIIQRLETDGYIRRARIIDSEQYWENTITGNQLALATAAKPIKRSTAEKKLREFLDRVTIINGNDYYLYKVTSVVLFGSYLSDSKTVNDIDIAIRLKPKETNPDKFDRLRKQRVEEARSQGRQFSTFLDELFWPENEVKLFLKSRSRCISLHSLDVEYHWLKDVKHKEIYP